MMSLLMVVGHQGTGTSYQGELSSQGNGKLCQIICPYRLNLKWDISVCTMDIKSQIKFSMRLLEVKSKNDIPPDYLFAQCEKTTLMFYSQQNGKNWFPFSSCFKLDPFIIMFDRISLENQKIHFALPLKQ